MIKKARKKPVEIEFIHFTDREKGQEIIDWMDDVDSCMLQGMNGNPFIYIATLEGSLKADINDYVVRGVHGEFYAVKPDIFRKTYDILNEDDTSD